MELRQLKQVVVLSQTLNFHRAAEQLHMAQPPLSASIRKLEEELGVALFERRPRALRVTAAGEIVLQHARRALADVDEIQRAARECAGGEQGRLVVAFVGTASVTLLPRLIPAFRERYPRVELVLQESTTQEMLRRLERREIDAALLRTPVLEPTRAALTPLERDHWLVAVHARSRWAQRDRISLQELADEPFIVQSPSVVPAMHTLVRLAFDHAGIHPPIAQEVVQVQTQLALVESGLAVALVPAVARHQAGDGVRLLPVADMPEALAVGIALAVDAQAPSAAARRLVEVAQALAG
ncbi:MAG: LysR family transcriptional regulator [Proteobacteria bacterium]|nr:LysR family transcriptional regulator [Pseudomonadota bacterium]